MSSATVSRRGVQSPASPVPLPRRTRHAGDVAAARPAHGKPARGARQAAVVGTDGALTDALATALLESGREGARWFAALPGWSAYVLDGDTTTAWGPAFTTSIPVTGGEGR